MSAFTTKYRDVILNRMCVAGETNEASEATTTLIEKIVRDNIIHMITTADDLATRRGSPKFTVTDILFQVRNDPPRLERLKDYLRWRKIRSTAAKSEKEASGDADLAFSSDEDLPAAASSSSSSSSDDNDDNTPQTTTSSTANPSKPTTKSQPTATDIPPSHLPWSTPLTFFPLPLHHHEPHPLSTLDLDTDLLTRNRLKLTRLRKNDQRARDMSPQEYMQWAEKRKSSFTSRKRSQFRDWCRLGEIADHKTSDDEVPGLLNMLAVEWVEKLTEEAMRVRQEEEARGIVDKVVGGGREELEVGVSDGMGGFMKMGVENLSKDFMGRGGEREGASAAVEADGVERSRETSWEEAEAVLNAGGC
ncbi:transcription initiation factor IID, 18kD subunit-domain-containing protein [Podospora aff. communis PSN243]|uniref:Transcription initiation factor IID, 18kD subunit-domain-containing protein n=1 Tax=Podospora aff. communis PSN243 TaxID=3040156 RepID=A0AAV9GRQ8_9PEZI|nr:transcription initiation factor IID, 18kD subunit-domain-containing protein [Podospora aff. communis PSN243]